jgi:hypothetical protein
MKACPNCHSKYPDDANFCPQETCATPQGPRRLEPVPAEPAPRFQLTSKLGGGRSGEVWVARDAQSGDDVAYKLVTPEVLPTPAASERALRELKQLQRAQNPHLVRIVDFGRSGDGRLFVATELANGQPLDRLVQGAGALPVDRAKKIVAQIGEALLEGQKVGVVHHDLSAKNVLVGPEDAVKVINFVTPWPITDTIFGVPEYLSPEQAEGKLVDQRSNTYSLGAILQLMLTGQPPVSGGDVQTVLAQVIQGTVTPPSQLRQGLTPEIDRVVLKAMEKNSSRRPLTMRQFLAEVAGVVGLPAGPAAAPTAGAKGAAFAKTMMFAGGAPEVQNLVNQAQAARDAANGAAAATAAAASAAASLPKAPTPAPVADPTALAAARRTHGAAVAATMMALPSAASGPLPGALPPAEPRPAPTPAPAMQAAAPSGGGGGGAGGGGGGAAGGGGGSGGGGGGGAGFRETLWFKKGDVEQMVAEAKAKAAAAAAKGKPAPVVEEAPVEDVKPLEDRYKDDGSVTVEDRKKFSLRSGGTAAGLPVVAGVVPGERMSDNEMINEIGGGKKIAIIGVAVAVVAIIIAIIVMSMHKKHDGAAAAEAPAAKATEMAAAAPAPAAPTAPAPAAPAAAPAPIAAAPAEAPAAAETPPKAQASPAHKHVAKATKKKGGKKHH